MDHVRERSVTIAEAARLTGLPKAAIRGRVESGELRAVRRGGVRRGSLGGVAHRGPPPTPRRHGFPAPAVYEARERELVLERCDGPTMMADIARAPWRVGRHGRTLGELH